MTVKRDYSAPKEHKEAVNTSLRIKSTPVRGCWWWRHSQPKWVTAGRHSVMVSGTHRCHRPQHSRHLIHDQLQQEGTLSRPWLSLCLRYEWSLLWEVGSLALRPQSAETTEPQKPGRRDRWRQKDCQDGEDWRLWILVTAQMLLLYL